MLAGDRQVKKTTGNTIKSDGPSKDGIDHDHDIYLWLNPKIDLAVTDASATWTLANTATSDIQYIYVGWFKDPSRLPPGLTQQLQAYGITAQHFPTILQRDPFASGSSAIDPVRYQSVNTTFPYEPPYSGTDPVPTFNFALSNASATITGSSSQDDFKVGLTVSGTAGFLDIAKVKLQANDSWDWTNTSSKSSSTGISESASVTVGGPAFGYTGPTDMQVSYDTVYKSFLFVPLQGVPVAFSGTLTNSAGKPVAMSQVSAVANGVTYRTITNANGQYRFFGNIRGPLTVNAGTVRQTLPQVWPDTILNLRLP